MKITKEELSLANQMGTGYGLYYKLFKILMVLAVIVPLALIIFQLLLLK